MQASGQWSKIRKMWEIHKTNKLTLASVGAQGKAESICATLWDAIWVVWLLALLCLFHLHWIQVAVYQLGMKTLEDREVGSKECEDVFDKFLFSSRG